MSTLKVDNQGRIVTPASWRSAQGIKPGSELVVMEEDGRLIVQTREQAVREAQAIIRKYVPAGVSLVDELMRDRKRDLEMENRELRESSRRGPRRRG